MDYSTVKVQLVIAICGFVYIIFCRILLYFGQKPPPTTNIERKDKNMNLKEVREKNKLSQAAFAKSIGVSPSAVFPLS